MANFGAGLAGFGAGIERGVRIGVTLDQAKQHKKTSELQDMLLQEKLTALQSERTRSEVRQSIDQANAIRGALAARRKAGAPVDSSALELYSQHVTTAIQKAYGDALGDKVFAGLLPTGRGTFTPIVTEKDKDGNTVQKPWNQNLDFDDSAPPLELTPQQIDEQVFRLDAMVDLINESGETFESEDVRNDRRSAEYKHELRLREQTHAANEDIRVRRAVGNQSSKQSDYEFLVSQGMSKKKALAKAFGGDASVEIGKTARELLKSAKDPITGKPTMTLDEAFDQARAQYLRGEALDEEDEEEEEGGEPSGSLTVPDPGAPRLGVGIDPDRPPTTQRSESVSGDLSKGLIDRSGPAVNTADGQQPTPNGEGSRTIDLLGTSQQKSAPVTKGGVTISEPRTFTKHPFGQGQRAVTIKPEKWAAAVNLLFKDPSPEAQREFAEFSQLPLATVEKMVKQGKSAAIARQDTQRKMMTQPRLGVQ